MSLSVNELLESIASADPEERRRACLAAAENPAAVLLADALGGALGDPVKSVARAASDALAEIGARMGGVENALREALRGDEPSRRWRAAFTIARLEPPSPRLLPPLVEALGALEGDVRWLAVRVIVEIGRLHGEVLPLLLGLVRGGERAVVRRMATFALSQLAPDRLEAAEVLLAATRDGDLHVRRAAFTAIASLSMPPAGVVARLLDAVDEDRDGPTRRLAALALGEMGNANPEAIPPEALHRLRATAESCEDSDLRGAIRRALERIGAER